MSLTCIGEQITVYLGSVILIIGLVGNGLNILVFFTNRRTSSAFYNIIVSLFNALYILINLLSRIISVGFGFDLSSVSKVWCKLRQFCIFTLSLSIIFTNNKYYITTCIISRNVYYYFCCTFTNSKALYEYNVWLFDLCTCVCYWCHWFYSDFNNEYIRIFNLSKSSSNIASCRTTS